MAGETPGNLAAGLELIFYLTSPPWPPLLEGEESMKEERASPLPLKPAYPLSRERSLLEPSPVMQYHVAESLYEF